MKSADKMRRLFNSAAVQTNATPDDAVFEKIKTAYTRTVEHKSAQQEPRMWRSVMKNPSARLAIAAVVTIACLIGLSLWRTTGSGIALADVLARVEQVKAFRCTGSVSMTGEAAPGKPYQWQIRYICLKSAEYGVRARQEQVDPNGSLTLFGETYLYPQKKILIQIGHAAKKYTRTELDDAELQRMQKELGRYSDPGGFLKEIVACRHESLGRSTIDGIEVERFGTSDPNCRGGASGIKNPQVDIKVWIDLKTRLPVRYESFTAGLDQTGNRMSFRLVMHGFQWDVPFAVAEFELPPIPDGYEVADQFSDLANEETAIQGLKQCVELLGNYPERIDLIHLLSGVDKSETSAALRFKEGLKGLTGLGRDQKRMDALKPIRLLVKFYLGLDKKDPAYYGRTVTPKDPDKVLLRWKLSDNEYRVIFGDLHAETVTPEKLAELEAALSK